MNPKTFCVAPWLHANVNTHGQLRPCCVSKQNTKQPVAEFDQWWNGAEMQQLRQDLMSGNQNADCERCWQSESQGRPSLRQSYNSMLPRHGNLKTAVQSIDSVPMPTTWELDIGNSCNLQCVMCWPHLSNKIQNEVLAHQAQFKAFPNMVRSAQNYSGQQWPLQDTDFLTRIQSSLRWVKIQGGEALTVKNIRDFIEALPADTVLTMTTNGTVLDRRTLAALSRLQKVMITVSIEAASNHNDTIRYGSSWTVIERNIDQYLSLPNVELQLNHVLQATSVFYLADVIRFAEQKNLHLNIIPLDQPNYLSLQACPPKYLTHMVQQVNTLTIVHNKNQYIKTFIDSVVSQTKFDLQLWQQFVHYVEVLDSVRTLSLKKILPFDYSNEIPDHNLLS